MFGNPWHAALVGSSEIERRRELRLRQRKIQDAWVRSVSPGARLQVWMGSRLIQAGEALRQAGNSFQKGSRDAGAAEEWWTRPSRI